MTNLIMILSAVLITTSSMQQTAQGDDRFILLYKVNEEQSIFVVDKLNKLSVADGSLNSSNNFIFVIFKVVVCLNKFANHVYRIDPNV